MYYIPFTINEKVLLKKLYEFYKDTYNVSDDDWKIFSSKLTRMEVRKGSLLLEIGGIEQHLYFIEEGLVRYYVPKEENDVTLGFAFPNSFSCVYDSFLTQTPSTQSVEVLIDTVCWVLNYEDLQSIYKKTKIGDIIGRKTAEQLYLVKTKRELSLLNKTATERYLALFESKPELFKLIPLKYIASYIGITPQALSRIRRRIS